MLKALPSIMGQLASRKGQHNVRVLGKLLLAFVLLVVVFSVLFQLIMRWEGQTHSWMAGIYWTLVVMSTLGFGDITFTSDVGRLFSIVVLLSGTVFLLILLPFTFIQFFFVPWMEAQAAARAPRKLPKETEGHVVLTALGPVDAALIRHLQRSEIPYVVVCPDLTEALLLHDQGYRVMVGDLDDPETYRRLQVEKAELIAATRSDMNNANVAFTVREISETVPIVATASFPASVDILEFAGCNRVLQLGEMLGQSLARRILGRDAKSHVIGQFGDLLVAEAAATGTPLVGRTLADIRLREHANVNVVGVWNRGRFQIAGPQTVIHDTSVLVLAGSRAQLNNYDELFCIYKPTLGHVVIIGGGRVGRATAKTLETEGIDFRIVERSPERVRLLENSVLGDAAEIEVLQRAGILEASAVVVTTHDDDMNVYLTIYCRKLRPDIQILGRATVERNISTLHRAGADFVLSYASIGANILFNLLQRMDTLLLAEGLNVFRLPIPRGMAGRSLAESQVRESTGCNVIAVVHDGQMDINPAGHEPLPTGAELIVIGDAEAEQRFVERFPRNNQSA
ncbi:MAG: potassium channel protein [Pirellulales bacterium]|nr:potassium channel protein [Pirellulales bacterium]